MPPHLSNWNCRIGGCCLQMRKVLSVKEDSEGSERGSDGEQDPVVRKWC